jgi:hypothetical protein
LNNPPMKNIILFCLLGPLLVMPCPSGGGMFVSPDKSGHPWHFNGRGFSPGRGDGSVVVLVRDGYLPVADRGSETVAPTTPMPDGQGVIAGICYIQVSGGKLAGRSGTLPMAGYSLKITAASGESRLAATDDRGYFLLPLPAGVYQVQGEGAPAQVTVTAGKTSLVALRTGKRMAD